VYDTGNFGVSGRKSAKERKMMARFRSENEERENRYDGNRGKKVQNVQ
jgi:hypothetical protein